MLQEVKLNLRNQVKQISNNDTVLNFYIGLLSYDNEFMVDSFDLYKYKSFYACFKIQNKESFMSHRSILPDEIIDEIQAENKAYNLINRIETKKLKNAFIQLSEGDILQDVIEIKNKKYLFKIEPFISHNNLYPNYRDETHIIFNRPYKTHNDTTKYTIMYKCCFYKVVEPLNKQIEKIKKPKITNTKPLLTDEELIKLFDETPKQKNKKNRTKQPFIKPLVTIKTNIIKDDIEDDTTSEISDDTNNTDASFDSEINLNNTYNFNILYNNKRIWNTTDKEYIDNLIYYLYDTNEKFIKMMSGFDTIYVLKEIHQDRNKSYKHFTAFLKNNFDESLTYHFYVKDNKINGITQIMNIL